jgi:hypothetical protein
MDCGPNVKLRKPVNEKQLSLFGPSALNFSSISHRLSGEVASKSYELRVTGCEF